MLLAYRLVKLIENHSHGLADNLRRRYRQCGKCSAYANVPDTELTEKVCEVYHHLGEWLLGKTEADIRNDMREQAISNVKTSLIVSALADAEHIEVSNDEVNAAMDELLQSGSLSRTDARRLRSSTSARSSLRNRIRRQKSIRRLVNILTGEEISPEATESATGDREAPSEENVPEEIGV